MKTFGENDIVLPLYLGRHSQADYLECIPDIKGGIGNFLISHHKLKYVTHIPWRNSDITVMWAILYK